MGDLALSAHLEGVRELSARLGRFDAGRDLDQTLTDLGGDAQRSLALVAPRATGRLARGIQFRRSGLHGGEVVSTARNPTTGFAYTRVTREGHGEIRPRADREIATVINTGRLRSPHGGHRPALRFVIGGRVVYAAKVKAWRPPGGDWVPRADGMIRDARDRRLGELKQRLVRQIVSGP